MINNLRFENLKCKKYPEKCEHEDELESIYEHGVCLDCKFIPDIVQDYYKYKELR